MRILASTIALLLLTGSPLAAGGPPSYVINYHVTLNPGKDRAEVVIESDHGGLLQQLDFNVESGLYSAIEANGQLSVQNGRALWQPPENNARLTLQAKITQERSPGQYDALMTRDWAIFRGDDLIPAARVKALNGARAEAYLEFELPEGWTSVSTGWDQLSARRFRIDNPERRFDRPTGWMIAGKLGTRRQTFGHTEIAVSAPKGTELRRMDILTLLTMVWPELEQAFGTTPPKIAIIGHSDPMWRGGLSGPNALFVHADRPMVGENGTSTLLHELMHVVTRLDGKANHDWIVEGLAEYYSIELLYRAGAMSDARRELTYNRLKDRASHVDTLLKDQSSGATTDTAVLLFDALDRELRGASDGEHGLDQVTRTLISQRRVGLEQLKAAVEERLGGPSKTLNTPLLEPASQ